MAEEQQQQSLEGGRFHQYESHGDYLGEHNEGGELEGETDYSDDDRTLFVGDVPRTVAEDQLRELFLPYGEVTNVQIKRDKVTQCSLGYAFIQFKERQQAAEAKKVLHKFILLGRSIRIGWAQKNTNLFVGDLDPAITTEQLREAFRPFGPIVEEETFVKQLNYGFVKFKHRAHAEKAKREMDGKLLGSRPIRLGWGDSNTQKHCVHIQFEGQPTEELTEIELKKSFEKFGEVVNVSLPRSRGELKGYAFVYYEDNDEGEDSASRAINEFNNNTLAGVKVKCHYGKKQSNTYNKHPGGGGGMGGPKKYNNNRPNYYSQQQQQPYSGQGRQYQHGGRDNYGRGGGRRHQQYDMGGDRDNYGGYQSGSPRGGRYHQYQQSHQHPQYQHQHQHHQHQQQHHQHQHQYQHQHQSYNAAPYGAPLYEKRFSGSQQ